MREVPAIQLSQQLNQMTRGTRLSLVLLRDASARVFPPFSERISFLNTYEVPPSSNLNGFVINK